MGRTHYIYMNGSSGCMPDTLDLCFSVEEAVGMFETIFGEDLYCDFDLQELIDSGAITVGVVYHRLENFFTEDDWEFSDSQDYDEFLEKEFDALLENGSVKRYVSDDIFDPTDAFGEIWYDYRLNEFRKTGYISLGPDYGADYASWSPCDCDSPWEHSELSMEQWIREHGDLWFTEHYEVRLRYEGDSRPWEEIEVLGIRSSDHDEHDLEECIYKVLIENDRRRVLEVRWNWVGDSQGHYFVPEYAEAA